MKYSLLIISMLALAIMITGCAQEDHLSGYCGENEKPVVVCEAINISDENVSGNASELDNGSTVIIIDDIEDTEEEIEDDVEEEIEEVEYVFTQEYNEGDLVSFSNLQVTDPDGDPVELSFSAPLDDNGEWQTGPGDEGEYVITITASDGKAITESYAKITVLKTNSRPVINADDEITVLEGETVVIESTVEDADGDEIEMSYSGWVDQPVYTTTYDDAGEHTVTITASDGVSSSRKDIQVIVIDVNRAPVIEEPKYDIIVFEGETVELMIPASDPDGDPVSLSYEEPFDNEGTWVTQKGDAGRHVITVSATDGEETVSIEVTVIVESTNNPPELEEIDDITIEEGETVSLDIETSDEDGDDLTITISGWMTDTEYTTNYDDAGQHTVTVTVSDGTAEVSQDITVTVEDVNRAPEFVWG